jgi:hypothetical protein
MLIRLVSLFDSPTQNPQGPNQKEGLMGDKKQGTRSREPIRPTVGFQVGSSTDISALWIVGAHGSSTDISALQITGAYGLW